MIEYIAKLELKENLRPEEMEDVMHQIMSGEASKDEMANFLLSLRAKGPTVEEITGAAKIMRQFVVPIETIHPNVLDTCGTGGDKKNTFNISTLTAIVIAAADVIVAKHGNRSVSSKCGSADILEALGVNVDINQDKMKKCLEEVGLAFLFAQKLHPAMKNVAPVRKELAVETIFNILGPLTNPAKATHQIVGVYNRDFVEPMANVLMNLGLKKALVVHGADGLDEITTTDKTFIAEYNGREVISYDIDPEELGIERAKVEDLEGGTVEDNVKIVEDILNNEEGRKKDIVVLNAAYGLYVAERVDRIEDGLKLADELIASGKAKEKLEQLKSFSHQ